MLGLIVAGIVAGFLAGISPCILPVLPVVLVAGTSAPASLPEGAGPPAKTAKPGLARSLAVVGGLVLSFSLIVLAGSEILSLLHLPQDALRDAGIALLILVGLGYLVPSLGTLLERPFARVGTRLVLRVRQGSHRRPGRPAGTRLPGPGRLPGARRHRDARRLRQRPPHADHRRGRGPPALPPLPGPARLAAERQAPPAQIGRASCRERV